MSKKIVRLSAQQTADWIGGAEVNWMEGLTDPKQRAAYQRHRTMMRRATLATMRTFVSALEKDSPSTQARLLELMDGVEAGDRRSQQLAVAMLTELMKQGFA